MYSTGLIVGRFNPPHLGHSHMIDWAAERCGTLVVYVNTRDGEAVPGSLRAGWLADLHPQVRVIEVRHNLDTNWDWTRVVHLMATGATAPPDDLVIGSGVALSRN